MYRYRISCLLIFFVIVLNIHLNCIASKTHHIAEKDYPKMSQKSFTQRALFALGCFWKPEYEFRRMFLGKGLIESKVGYCGGDDQKYPNPSYETVCTGQTGHAETVKLVYDPQQVTYKQLLDKFWELHDPTQVNRQGLDQGTQYRSVIFYDNEEQKELAEKSKEEMQKQFTRPIATQIQPAQPFYEAEEYHQQYLEKKRR